MSEEEKNVVPEKNKGTENRDQETEKEKCRQKEDRASPKSEKTSQKTKEAAETEQEEKQAEKDEKAGRTAKGKKGSHEKEKTYTLTREEMETAERTAKQLVSVKDQFLRLTAEYDNYRKRTTREKETIYQDAKSDAIKELLPIYDNLERALATDADPNSPHRKGMEMIFNQFREILKKMDITEMDAKGKPFDPNKHNAVMHVDDENLGENVVADVFQAGFMMGDKVLRFATVQVAN